MVLYSGFAGLTSPFLSDASGIRAFSDRAHGAGTPPAARRRAAPLDPRSRRLRPGLDRIVETDMKAVRAMGFVMATPGEPRPPRLFRPR